MKFRLFCLLLLFFSVNEQAVCQRTNSHFYIEAGISNVSYNGPIYMSYPNSAKEYNRDTLLAINGKFKAIGIITEPVNVSFSFENSTGFSVYMDTGLVHIVAKIDSFYQKNKRIYDFQLVKIAGSKIQDLYEDYVKSYKEMLEMDTEDSLASINLFQKLLALSVNYSNAGIISDLLADADYLSSDQANIIIRNLSIEQQNRIKLNLAGKLLERLKVTQIGSKFFYLAEPDTSGKKIDISKLKYSYLFVTFWSSTCGPCRQEHPALINIYNKYKNRGLEILGISLDYSKEAWIKALNHDKINWINVSDLHGNYNKISTYYSITYIPYNLLVDRNGNIIAKNLTTISLENKIGSLLQ